MKFCAIISEFNPFHNGHKYLISQAKEILNMPVLCLMSGNFVQRGEPAIIDKYSRANSAINAGADIIVELPTIYALSSAQNFAYGAIKVLKSLGCTNIVIGVTHTKLEDYYILAKIKNSNIKSSIRENLDKGCTYSKSLTSVLKAKYPNCEKIFCDASNILALEYIEQIIEQDANIQITLVKRTDGGYNAKDPEGDYANASTIRQYIENNLIDQCKRLLPDYSYNSLKNLSDINKINDILFYNLRNIEGENLSKYYDYNEGLPYLISNTMRESSSLEEAISKCTSKRYRTSRIRKLCYYPILSITKSNADKILHGKDVVKLLAIKRQYKQFISDVNKKEVKVIVSNYDYKKLKPSQKISATLDLAASNLYSIATGDRYNSDITKGTNFY